MAVCIWLRSAEVEEEIRGREYAEDQKKRLCIAASSLPHALGALTNEQVKGVACAGVLGRRASR